MTHHIELSTLEYCAIGWAAFWLFCCVFVYALIGRRIWRTGR